MNSDPLPNDGLDPLLRTWHEQNAARAQELRNATIARIGAGTSAAAGAARAAHTAHTLPFPAGARRANNARWFGRGLAAAALVAIAIAGAFLLPIFPNDAVAGGLVMMPDGGRLTALDRQGNTLGPCPLAHTDVHADIAGPFTRVTLAQKFQNPYRVPIEAVYTFPLGERSAVDRMRMIVNGPSGERIVDGVVKERDLARFIYEAAREQGYVASLLEQERPNIFTQSVANIEPGSTVTVEISYVETLAMKDGTYGFSFPMVVGPRYVPGQTSSTPPLPAGWTARTGVILLGPAAIELAPAPEKAPKMVPGTHGTIFGGSAAGVLAVLEGAIAVQAPSSEQLAALGAPVETFTATYADGSKEPGALFAAGCGAVGGRWFVVPSSSAPAGQGFAADTNQVPDASRVTPMPARPGTRSGHDVSLSVSIDTGGPGVRELVSQLHGVDVKWDGNSRCTLALRGGSAIPNRDFVLNWGLEGRGVLEGAFSYARQGTATGASTASDHAANDALAASAYAAASSIDGFVTLVMTPPPAAANAPALPRELVFVLDTSGSMNGFPMEKSKEVMRRALASMRADDTFNIVTFAGNTAVLWPELRAATPDNVKTALDWVNARKSGGGTEMMKAIEAALVQMPQSTPTVAPDGTVSVPPRTPVSPPPTAGTGAGTPDAAPAVDGGGIDDQSPDALRRAAKPQPMRVVVFLTDGYVGNDRGIIAAIDKNAGSTRVFTFGIGNSVNRYLLEEMALHGRGACDIVLLSDGADKAVELFTRRIQSPLLRDISVSYEGVEVTDTLPSGRLLPDLFDMQPLVIHGRWSKPGTGTIVVRGQTVSGAYERRIPVTFAAGPGAATASTATMLPQLWARTKVDTILAPHLQAVEQQTLAADVRQSVVAIAEQFQIMSPYTSFVAVEKSRIIVGGKPMLVTVPIEFPDGLRWEGFFGDTWCNDAIMAAARDAAGETAAAVAGEPAGSVGHSPSGATFGQAREAEALGREQPKSKDGRAAGGKAIRFVAAAEIPTAPPPPGLTVATASTGVSQPVPAPASRAVARNEQVALGIAAPTRDSGAAPGATGASDLRDLSFEGRRKSAPADRSQTKGSPDAQTRIAAQVQAPVQNGVSSGGAAAGAAGGSGGGGGGDGGFGVIGGDGLANVYHVQPNDTLSGIAVKVLGDSKKWSELLDANKELLGNNERALKPGMVLVVPAPAPAADQAAPRMAIPLGARDTLVRVLERRLLALALYERLAVSQRAQTSALPADIAGLSKPAASATVAFGDAVVSITVLVAADGEAAIAALRELGFTVTGEGQGPGGARILVGETRVSKLVQLALVSGVVRIEPLQETAAPPTN